MADELVVTIRGIESIAAFDEQLKRIPIAATRAVNFAADRARAESGRRIREQLNFAARYLTGADGKIEQTRATKTTLQARLSARSRPTSLARFVTTRGRQTGVKVSVKPGTSQGLPGAFIVGVGNNQLLAIRSPKKPRTAFKPKRLGSSLWLLYGPSVAQSLISRANKGIWPTMEAEIVANLEREFLRQMQLKV